MSTRPPSLEQFPAEPGIPTRSTIAILDVGGTFGRHIAQDDSASSTGLGAPETVRDVVTINLNRHLARFQSWSPTQSPLHHRFKCEWLGVDEEEDERLLSENATPRDWGKLISRLKEHLTKFQHCDRLAGIIVIHGTDTMAYVIPAVQLAVEQQSIPIVFVGSNYPLLLDAKQHRRLALMRSDAWPNLLNAVRYCDVAELSIPQVLLSFSGCIHQALNLRKIHESAITSTDVERRPAGSEGTRASNRACPAESYVFNNALSKSKYLGRTSNG